MSEIASAVCSITVTQRRRYFWAAWWTGTPQHQPFRKPDAAHGGARSAEEALAEAERLAGRHLSLIEPYWARAWSRVLRGERPPPPPAPRSAASAGRAEPDLASPWTVLGIAPGASLSEVKRAYRRCALATHPDRGGSADDFRAAQRAYEKLAERLTGRGSERRAARKRGD